jgi:hypothetical protein
MKFSKRNKKTIVAVVLIAATLLFTASWQAKAIKLGDILDGDVGKVIKGAAVLALTVGLADQLDSFINTITLNKGVPEQAGTKVVPIIALGSGTRVGAAQVSGPKDLVEKTKIVVQIEAKFGYKNLDVEVFVPSDNMNPLKFNRVEGVGVSALIDLRASGL